MADELTKALLFEEAAPPAKIAEALFASVMGSVPLVQALIESHALSLDVLSRHLERSGAPFLTHVVPIVELAGRLPPGLCARLLAIPVRVDAITGTVDVAMANPMDPHPAQEIAFHLGAPVRAIRASVAEIEGALRQVRMSAHVHSASVGGGAAGASAYHERDRSHAPATLAPRARAPEQSVSPRRGGLILDTDSAHPPADAPGRIRTPPWGTHVQEIRDHKAGTEPPESGYGSEIPIPLTRKGTPTDGSPPPPASLGEGYALDTRGLRAAVERTAALGARASGQPVGAFIPAPPPVPTLVGPQPPFAEMHGVLSALRNAASRDEVLELVLMGAAVVAPKVAVLIVKKGGYVAWGATPELADRVALQSVQIPLDANSLFDRVVRDELYLGPIPRDEVHAPLLRVLKSACRDVAAVPIRVSGKTAVIIVADDLRDTIGTRRLEELARAAGEAFARIVRTRR